MSLASHRSRVLALWCLFKALQSLPDGFDSSAQQCDQQLQRALNYENFEAASQIRQQREQLDEALEKLSASKGPGEVH